MFGDNSMTKATYYKGSSGSKLLHELIPWLCVAESKFGCIIHLAHIAGTHMITQGMDGVSRGLMSEGVMRGEDMLAFITLNKSATQVYPPLCEWLASWILREDIYLDPMGGTKEVMMWWDTFKES
eukprot:7562804-Ditylum_brightwellii.AAC.1